MNHIHRVAKIELSQLILIDMQTKLSAVMQADAMQQVIENCGLLAQASHLLNVPMIVTEQYPQGLGNTLAEIKQLTAAIKPIEKTTFSAVDTPKFNQQLHRDQPQLIIAGMEAHICVLQTALDLIAAHKQVFIVEDAIISRNVNHKLNAVARMRDAGCTITNTESVLFEWLAHSQHPMFKHISQLIR